MRIDDLPDGELHAARVATVDVAARTCTVTFPKLDGGLERSRPIPYDPHVVAGEDGLELDHPVRDDRALVPEDNTGGLWVAQWTHDG